MEEQSVWSREFDEHSEEAPWLEDPKENDIVSKELTSLINLGELKGTYSIRDTDIILKTLKMEDELKIGLLIDKYQRTLEEGRAYATAVVAAAIDSINGYPLVASAGPFDDLLAKKFNYVRTNMYWPVIKAIYEEGYIPLVEKQLAALDEFRKK